MPGALKGFLIGLPFVAAVTVAVNVIDMSRGLTLLLFAITVGIFSTLAAALQERDREARAERDRSHGAPRGV